MSVRKFVFDRNHINELSFTCNWRYWQMKAHPRKLCYPWKSLFHLSWDNNLSKSREWFFLSLKQLVLMIKYCIFPLLYSCLINTHKSFPKWVHNTSNYSRITRRWWHKEETARGGTTNPHVGCFLLTSHPPSIEGQRIEFVLVGDDCH